MARTSYQAPGVYVEEIPSAQQPIAGVGTNTLGFIGIVPDVIEYPVRNDDYDPVLLKLAMDVKALLGGGQEVKPATTQQLDSHIKELQANIDALKAERPNLESDRDEKTKSLPALEEELKGLEGGLKGLEGAEETDQKKKVRDQKSKINETKAALVKLDDRLKKIDSDIPTFEQRIKETEGAKKGEIVTPPTNIASSLRPYLMKKFDIEAKVGETKLCTNFTEYQNRFGGFSADNPDKPGEALYPGHRYLTHAVNGFFQNGGTKCFVARIKDPSELSQVLKNFESIDAVAIIAAPGFTDQNTYSELVSHCEKCEDRFAILDCPPVVGNEDELEITLLNYDRSDNVLPQRNKNAAYYFPWIEVVDPAKQLQDQDLTRNVELKYRGRLFVPPSGHIAGIYARTDETRGVHKAPANAAVLGALNVKYYIGRPKQELLNPQGVNVIRNMNGNIAVWGARTAGGDKNGEWKYINVRRLFLFLSESIDEGTQWVVFEPNDRALWGKIRRNVSDFLRNVWRSGALFGSSPEEAFYVKCDDETNPPEVRDAGMVVTEIGVSIVRPAEFVIFRITQSTGGPKG